MNFFESPEWFCIIFVIIFALVIFGISGLITLWLYLKERRKDDKKD